MRLPDHDYRSPGAYFVTLCVHAGECLLGEVVDGEMCLNEWGHVVSHYWIRIPDHSDHVQLDAWVVMPNHLHGILVITEPVRAQHAAPLPRTNVQPGSLGAIIRSFKSAATRRTNRLRDTPGARVWQRNYHEHIVRNTRRWNGFANTYSTTLLAGPRTSCILMHRATHSTSGNCRGAACPVR